NAEVKVGLIEQHLVSKEFPDAKEISLLIQFDRVISEWITRAIIRGGRHHQTNHDCHNRYKRCDMHIQSAPVSTRRARTDTSERLGRRPNGPGEALLRKPITGTVGFCAFPASGHVAAPPSSVMNSRRLVCRERSIVRGDEGRI